MLPISKQPVLRLSNVIYHTNYSMMAEKNISNIKEAEN